ncbi:MAG: hypothetical protein HY040_14610 [Planctomycetes bacterium]|nr:hypothetical protein [Planctomycetota bacterium]
MSEIPPAVRILPMDSKDEPGFAGCSAQVVQQQYFLRELLRPEKPPGRFLYHKTGLRAEPGTVVLFQYAGSIIASAVLTRVERFEKREAGCGGAFYFDVNSIKVFDPVSVAALRKIWPEVSRLGQAKWSLDPARYPAFERELTGIVMPTY